MVSGKFSNFVAVCCATSLLGSLTLSDMIQRSICPSIPPGVLAKVVLGWTVIWNSFKLLQLAEKGTTDAPASNVTGANFTRGGLFSGMLGGGISDQSLNDMMSESIARVAGGSSRRRAVDWCASNSTSTRFCDVAGMDEVKAEVEEVVDFLKDPERYAALGARPPRGVLLAGPPGTGKTLLARAVAGEAGVAFASTSGAAIASHSVAGISNSIIYELFRNATKMAPCIIYIDELDSLCKERGASGGGGIVEDREAAFNALLEEMDGFRSRSGNSSSAVIVLASTNRPEVLDPAVLRPGRFDRKIYVGLPDTKSRLDILRVHSEAKHPLSADVDLSDMARRTAGFSGADLEHLLNEAATLAARARLQRISAAHLGAAWEKVMLGMSSQRKVGAEAQRVVAVHEAGHALAGLAMEAFLADDGVGGGGAGGGAGGGEDNGAPLGAATGTRTPTLPNLGLKRVSKVTILPRLGLAGGGAARGFTVFQPDEDRADAGLATRQFLLADLVVTLAGRAAEELCFGPDGVTTGAGADLKAARRETVALVDVHGMSASGL